MRHLIAVMLVGAALVVAPVAHADRTLTPTQACQELVPGTGPINFGFFGTELSCVYWGPPVTHPMGGETLRQAMARVYPGSYSVNPVDIWSDWVIPD